MTSYARTIIACAAVALAVVGCTTEPVPVTPPSSPAPTATVSPSTSAPLTTPTGATTVLATGLQAPWSVVRLSTGSALISLRDSGVVLELTADGETREVGTVAGVSHVGESGLLGIAVAPGDESRLYAYLTTAADNRIVRIPLSGAAGRYALGDPEVVLDGLANARNHDGGRIAFGPDGMLYATVGDAGEPDRAQDLDSPNGKILRMTPAGDVPADNPFDSLVYSYGHRNAQGIAWDSTGQLFAAEFGQDTWDEFNRIEAGGNYGWPTVEGIANESGFIDPIAQWATDDASPSGLAAVGDTFFLASLRGERLWSVGESGEATPFFTGEFGRLRDAIPGPDGTIWLLTNNTDGRGSPTADDDRLIEVRLGG